MMAIEIPHPAECFRSASLHRLVLRYQKSPLLKIIPLNRPIVTVVPHRILLPARLDSISELMNMHNCEPTGRANARPMTGSAKQSISSHEERMDCFVASLLAMTLSDKRPRSRDVARPSCRKEVPRKTEGAGKAGRAMRTRSLACKN